MADFLNRIKSRLTPGMLQEVSKAQGVSPHQATKAIACLVPSLWVGLAEKMRQPQEALPWSSRLSDSGGVNSDQDLFEAVFGQKKLAVFHAAAAFAGVSPAVVVSLSSIAADVVMEILALHSGSVADMAQYLQQGQTQALRLLPAGVLAVIGGGFQKGAQEETPGSDWIWSLLLLLVLGGLFAVLAFLCLPNR